MKVTAPHVGWLKRMWVTESARGLGIGRRMLEALEAEARDLGITLLRLETNRTLKEATVRRYHYESHDQLREHLKTFLAAYNFARRLKTLRGLTPHEYICKRWTENPDQFRLNPFHHTPGLNT